jgi:hypothetical protein
MAEHNGAFMMFCKPLDTEVDWAKGEENETRFWALSEALSRTTYSA